MYATRIPGISAVSNSVKDKGVNSFLTRAKDSITYGKRRARVPKASDQIGVRFLGCGSVSLSL